MLEAISRNHSIVTGKNNLESLFCIPQFPIFFGCVDQPETADEKMDMSWSICPESGVIQLEKLVPLEKLYQFQHFDGTGATWKQYYLDFANYIKEQNALNILEIGGGIGNLAKEFINITDKTTWTIVEPNPVCKLEGRIKTIASFFDSSFKYSGQVDTIVHSQVLEHMYDPQEFIRDVSMFIKPGNKMVFGFPNLKLFLERKYTNAINFEHTLFLTEYFVDYFLLKNKFSILDKTYYKEHIFYTAQKEEYSEDNINFENKSVEYKRIFDNFIGYHKQLVNNLNNKISLFDGPVYVFGAHIFSQYLFEFGLEKSKIKGILDNSELKKGKRLYGYPFLVYDPETIRELKTVAVVLKVGQFRDEILKQLISINPNVKILED